MTILFFLKPHNWDVPGAEPAYVDPIKRKDYIGDAIRRYEEEKKKRRRRRLEEERLFLELIDA